MLITSFISHLGDTRIDSVLRHLYTEIRRLSSSNFPMPVEGEMLQNFPRIMQEARQHGLGNCFFYGLGFFFHFPRMMQEALQHGLDMRPFTR
jgi:hypothetical protein